MIFKVTPDLKYIKLVDEISDKERLKLKQYFKRKAVNFYFDPRYQNGSWDGYDSFFNNDYVAIGLWKELRDFLTKNGYPVHIEGLSQLFNVKLRRAEFDEFVNAVLLGTEITEPRWYQVDCAYNILKYRYCMAELATSAGKTLVSYFVAAYLKNAGELDKDNKFVMIVPRADLIGQTADKFETNYNNGTIPLSVARMGGKFNAHTRKAQKAIENADVIVATYQTLVNMKDEFFLKIRHINVDEAHTTTNASIRTILKKCQYLKHRFGLSGTIEINTNSADYCRLQEYLGPNTMVVTAKDLIDSDYSPDILIKTIKLEYDELGDQVISDYIDLMNNGKEMYVDSNEFAKALYKLERQIITSHPIRMKFIISLVRSLKMNTLILFNDVQSKYGFKIAEKLKEYNKYVYYIDGETKSDNRSDYTKLMEHPHSLTILRFNAVEIIVNQHKAVKLTDGKIKYAKDILVDDDVSDEWILENSK